MSKKIIKPEKIVLDGFSIIYQDGISYNDDKTTVAVEITLKIDGKQFIVTGKQIGRAHV